MIEIYGDIKICFIFNMQAQDKECQSIEDAEHYKWPPLTREGQWQTRSMELKPGLNVLHWKTIGMEAHGSSRPVLIKNIQISGRCRFASI